MPESSNRSGERPKLQISFERRRIFHHGSLYCCRALAPRRKCRNFQCLVNAHTYTPSFKREEFLSWLQTFTVPLQHNSCRSAVSTFSRHVALDANLYRAPLVFTAACLSKVHYTVQR